MEKEGEGGGKERKGEGRKVREEERNEGKGGREGGEREGEKEVRGERYLCFYFIVEELFLEVVQSIVSTVTVQVQWVEYVPAGGGNRRGTGAQHKHRGET